MANDAQVARTTVYEYFEVLKDTLILYELSAWRKSKKRKPLASSKYYFFDVGVVGELQGRRFKPGTPEFGEAFETYIMHELMSYCDYMSGEPLFYWRSTSGFEVDFILADKSAIEIKGKANITSKDLKGLKALKEEDLLTNYIIVCLEETPRETAGITILPWQLFLENLWQGDYK